MGIFASLTAGLRPASLFLSNKNSILLFSLVISVTNYLRYWLAESMGCTRTQGSIP